MPSTTNFAIPYPQASDTVDVPRDIQAVADKLETTLDPLRYQYSHRNRIINGDFSVNQRGFTSTTTNGAFGHDRWVTLLVGGTVTYSTQSFALGNAITGQEPANYARVVTSGQSAAGDYAILAQRIESVRTFAGQTLTVSFWAKANSGTPKVAVELEQFFGTGGSPSSVVSTVAGQATLSTTWTRYTLTCTLPSISGKTLGSNGNDYLQIYLWVSAGSNINTRTNSLGIQNNTFDFWGVQVEAGSYATSFERRPQQVELALCQRYYYRVNSTSGQLFSWFATGWARDASNAEFVMPLPVTMRAIPTVLDVANLRYADLLNGYTVSTIGLSTVRSSANAVSLSGTSTGMTAYRPLTIEGNNSSAAYIGVGAEL